MAKRSYSKRAIRRWVCSTVYHQIRAYLDVGQPFNDLADAVAVGKMNVVEALIFGKRAKAELEREMRKYYFWSGR